MSNGKGGFHFGNIGGNATLTAKGDIVGGDKTTTTTSPAITTGFQKEEDKAQFLMLMEEVRSMIREVKSMIGETEALDEDDRDELVMEAIQHTKALKAAREEAEPLPPGQELPDENTDAVTTCFDKISAFMTRVEAVGEKTADFADKVTPVASRVLPLLASARTLLGLP